MSAASDDMKRPYDAAWLEQSWSEQALASAREQLRDRGIVLPAGRGWADVTPPLAPLVDRNRHARRAARAHARSKRHGPQR